MKTRRRGFIGGLAATAGLMPFAGFTAVVKLRNPNSLLSHACVGTAHMAKADLMGLKACRDLHITALCDVDASFLEAAKRICPDARLYRNALAMYEKEGARIDSTPAAFGNYLVVGTTGKAADGTETTPKIYCIKVE